MSPAADAAPPDRRGVGSSDGTADDRVEHDRGGRPGWWAPTGGRPRWVVLGWVLVWTTVVAAAVRMVRHVLAASRLQDADYWDMIMRFTTPDGGLDVAGLFQFQNHPVVLPQLVYWSNIKLFDGSNRSLGLFVVATVLATVVVIACIARTGWLSRIEQMAVVAVAGVVLFSQNGTWNFVRSMSGTAWLLANLLVVVAVYLRTRDRSVAAFSVGVVAAMTYGTGILVWPALVAMGVIVRPPREWWKEAPQVLAAGATLWWYRSAGEENLLGGEPEVGAYLEDMVRVFGYPFDIADTSLAFLGYLPVLGLPALCLWAVLRVRTPAVAPWVGIATFAWLAAVQISYGRGLFMVIFGDQFRYTSVGSLAWVAFVALLLPVLRRGVTRLARLRPLPAAKMVRPAATVAAVLPIVLLGATAGEEEATRFAHHKQRLQVVAVSWRYGINDNAGWLNPLSESDPELVPRLEAMGHFPFVAGWSLDCGLMDQPVASPAPQDAEPVGELVRLRPFFMLQGGLLGEGWMAVDDAELECIVVTGDDDTVVGAGSVWEEDAADFEVPEGAQRVRLLARPGHDRYRVYGIRSDHSTVLIDETVTIGEPE